jgi:hypothetical protein
VVKLVDTLASGASGLTAVEVQVLSWAPYFKEGRADSSAFLWAPQKQSRTPSAPLTGIHAAAALVLPAHRPGHHILKKAEQIARLRLLTNPGLWLGVLF